MQSAPAVGASHRLSWWARHQRRLAPFLLLAPAVALFGTFVIYPIAASVTLSFYDWNGIGEQTFVGLGNYRELFADPVFYRALRNNVIWLAVYLAAPAGGLALALFLNQRVFAIRLARAAFLLPFVISQVVVGLIFSWFFNPQFGLLNRVLTAFGLQPIAPLENETWAIVAISVAGLWPQIAYCMILYLTGLASIRTEPIDAARVDGAGPWMLLRRIVLPELQPVSFIVAMVCVVSALRGFDLVMIMTAGGPYNSSTVLAYFMYEQTFGSFRFGYGATIATVLFVLMSTCVGFFLWRLLRREAR